MTALRHLLMSGVFAAGAVFASPLLSQQVLAQQAKPVATIDGAPVSEKDLAIASDDLGDRIESVPEATRRDQLIDYFVTIKIVAAQARKDKLAESADFKSRLSFMTDKALMESYLKKEGEKAASKQAIEAFYAERVKSVEPSVEVRARHILVPTEEEAKAIIAEIKAGKDFADLAKSKSKDPGSGAEGGDLGYFTKDRMVPEFAEAAFALEAGKISETPVKSQFGFHVIKVEDKRKQKVPELSEIEGQIRTFLSRKAQADLVAKLRAASKIEKTEAPAANAPAAPAVPKQ